MTDEQLFERAKELNDQELQVFVRRNGIEKSQAERIQKLLAADRSPNSLLDTTAIPSLETTEHERGIRRAIGDFEILGELGRGGMGVVYEARQKSLKRTVALKVLGSGLGLSSKAILRFRREAEAAGKLHHTNIVPIYTTGEDKGIHFYAMELINGPSLDQVIKERGKLENVSDESLARTASRCIDSSSVENTDGNDGKVAKHRTESSSALGSNSAAISTSSGSSYFDQVATIIADVAEALDHAHEHGVIHRDIKPSNLLLGPDGRLSINDFGLARMLEQPGMTVSGEFVGSPLYMSPEQITAGRVAIDHRTDIYSLGATLYELLTQQPPFPGQTRDQVLSQILHKEATSTRRIDRKIPLDFDTICMKAIDKDPDRRYQTAAQLADDLKKYVNRYAISARRVGAIVKLRKVLLRNKAASFATFCTITILAFSAWFYFQTSVQERTRNLQTTINSIYEKVLIYQPEEIPALVARAESLAATQSQMELLYGLEAMSRNEYQGAMVWFDRADTIASRALYANAMFWSGTEVGYVNELRELANDTPISFEEKLFFGVAHIWGNPEKAYRILKNLDEDRPSLQYVKTQRGEAARVLASLVEDDLQIAEGLFAEAYDLTGVLHEQISVETEGTRTLLLIDQALLYERLAESASTDEEFKINEARLVAKKEELNEFIDEVIRRLESEKVEKRAFTVSHALKFLGRIDELEKLAHGWWDRREPLQAFTSHFLATYFASKRDFSSARNWFYHVRSSGDEFTATQFILALIDSIDPDSPRDIEEIRADLRSECLRKTQSVDASALVFFDALILFLLGDDDFLCDIEKDGLLTQLHSSGNLDPIVEYFKKTDRRAIDRQELLLACENTNSPNLSIMHAHFALGIEDLVNGSPGAKYHFETCANGRQYIWYVNRLSEILLNHKESWPSFSKMSSIPTQ